MIFRKIENVKTELILFQQISYEYEYENVMSQFDSLSSIFIMTTMITCVV